MAKKVFSPEEADQLKQLRAALQDAENNAASELVVKGKASAQADDKVASILQRIRDITEADSAGPPARFTD